MGMVYIGHYCGVNILDGLGCMGSGCAPVGGSFRIFAHCSFCCATSSIANDTTLLITLSFKYTYEYVEKALSSLVQPV